MSGRAECPVALPNDNSFSLARRRLLAAGSLAVLSLSLATARLEARFALTLYAATALSDVAAVIFLCTTGPPVGGLVVLVAFATLLISLAAAARANALDENSERTDHVGANDPCVASIATSRTPDSSPRRPLGAPSRPSGRRPRPSLSTFSLPPQSPP